MKTCCDFTREYVRVQVRGSAEANLAMLSDRYTNATRELGLRSTPLLFALKHGRVSALHYRTLAEVFEVILCDFDEHPELLAAVHATVRWFWAARAPAYTSQMVTDLRTLGIEMRASWHIFEDLGAALHRDDSAIPRGPLDSVPKMHRAVCHLPDFIRLYGPFVDLTTEASETANKALKASFRTHVVCVCVHVRRDCVMSSYFLLLYSV